MRVFRDLSIKRKLTLVIMLTSSIALLLACAAFVIYDLVTVRRAMTRSLSILAEIVGANSTAALSFNDQNSAKEVLAALSAEQHIVSACIYTKDGKSFAKYTRQRAYDNLLPAEPGSDGSYFEKHHLALFQPIILDGERIGTVYIKSDVEEMYSRLRRYIGIVAVVMLVSSLVAFLLTAKFQQLISRPILHLAQTAKTISVEKNYSIRAVKHSQDELGFFIERFNEMLAQIQQRDEKLQQLGEYFHNVIKSMVDSLIVANFEGIILTVNKSTLDLLAYEEEELIGKPLTTVLEQDNKLGINDLIEQGFTRQTERRYVTKSGRKMPVLFSNSAMYDSSGHISAIVCVALDITERKLLESQLVQAQKLESIGQLAAGIAHEINTPIQYVGDNTRFLQDAFDDLDKIFNKYDKLLAEVKNRTVPLDLIAEIEAANKRADLEYLRQEIRKAVQESLEGVGRVAKIVRAMKEFSHPGLEEKTAIDMNHAIENTIVVARNEWKYVAEMVTDFDSHLPPVQCLPGEFNQVILNMIVNAAHAIADVVRGGSNGKGTITVTTRHDGDWAEIRISDTGTGIPVAVQNKIFDPFFTTKEVGRGTGQGLAIAHSVVVKKHSGTIAFETEVGKGTTFVIRLPIDGTQGA